MIWVPYTLARHVPSPPAARRVYAFASPGLFSGPAMDRIKNSALEEVVTVNTVPLAEGADAVPQLTQVRWLLCCPTLSFVRCLCGSPLTVPRVSLARSYVQLSVAPLIAESIQRIHTKKSISELFGDKKQ